MRIWLLILPALLLGSCGQEPAPLPVLSEEPVRPFSFVNQDSSTVTNADFAGKAYVADFFFTSCPTICPIMTQNMLRIYRRFEQEDRVLLLSHTIDPKRDDVDKLRHYAKSIGVSAPKWHFVTGDKDSLYAMADDYYSVVKEDQNLPDGFDHSGRLTLVGPDGKVRSYCNGTDAEAVDRFMEDLQRLLNEMERTADLRD